MNMNTARAVMGNTVTLGVIVGLGIERAEKRGRCSLCGWYRVLFAIAVASLTDMALTSYRCAECWDIAKPSDPDLGEAAGQVALDDVLGAPDDAAHEPV